MIVTDTQIDQLGVIEEVHDSNHERSSFLEEQKGLDPIAISEVEASQEHLQDISISDHYNIAGNSQSVAYLRGNMPDM